MCIYQWGQCSAVWPPILQCLHPSLKRHSRGWYEWFTLSSVPCEDHPSGRLLCPDEPAWRGVCPNQNAGAHPHRQWRTRQISVYQAHQNLIGIFTFYSFGFTSFFRRFACWKIDMSPLHTLALSCWRTCNLEKLASLMLSSYGTGALVVIAFPKSKATTRNGFYKLNPIWTPPWGENWCAKINAVPRQPYISSCHSTVRGFR
jgi:hypothetical protein